MRRFDGKSAIVTGASGGIGGAIVDGFLREGATVVGVGRDADALRSFAERRRGAKLDTAGVDLRDVTAIRAFMAAADRKLGGRLDVLVNCADIAPEDLASGPILH